MSLPAHIVALAARTPIGLTAESTAAALRAGISRVRRQRTPNDLPEALICVDSELHDFDLRGPERMLWLARSALVQILDKVEGLRLPYGTRIPVVIGLPEERPGWSRADVAPLLEGLVALSTRYRLMIEPAQFGHAAALEALQRGAEITGTGAPLTIIGGVDSYVDSETLDWLRESGRWQGESSRSGLIPGEGSAFVALTSPTSGYLATVPPLSTLVASSSARETKLNGTTEVSLGEGLTSAVTRALQPLGDSISVSEIYCDINGERYRTEEWGFVALRLGSLLRDPTGYRIGSGGCGDVGAATGALNLVLATRAWERRYARGDLALIWGSSDGGLRSAAVLHKADKGSSHA